MLDHHPRGEPIHDDCVTAVRAAADLLAALGHDVEPGWPAPLADPTLTERFMTVWATNMATGLDMYADLLGRTLTEDDVEPVNWMQAEFARSMSAVDHARSLGAIAAFRRQVHQWWADGWDLLLTPTLAEPPVPLGTLDASDDDPLRPLRRAAEFVPFTPAFNMSGQPGISIPLHWNGDGLPIGIQLVAAYGREDVLIRVAGQLEAAAPWAGRTP